MSDLNQIWGFDPLKLLETIEFPNDKYERLLRTSKSARMMAIARLPLSLDPSKQPTLSAPSPGPSSRRSSVIRRSSVAGAAAREEAALKDQLARSAAAIVIQSALRGWRTRRKFVAVMWARLSVQTHWVDGELGDGVWERGMPDVRDLTVQERLLRRYYKYCYIVELLSRPTPTFPYFAAAYIQAYWRMFIMKRSYKRFQEMSTEDRLGTAGKDARKEMVWRAQKAAGRYSTWDEAARKIQLAWKSYYNTKIYHFYRDLIKFRERGDPRKLLKFINPHEASLIDSAMRVHVKFRLGGSSFPPTIYYKIFVHNNLIDMNAFSPRDYTSAAAKQPVPRDLFDKTGPLPKFDNEGWYLRFENNGWRPVSDKLWDENRDTTTQVSAAQKLSYHYSKLKRRQEVEKAKRKRKLEWLQKMYQEGKRATKPLEEEEMLLGEEQIPPKAHIPAFESESDAGEYMAELEQELDADFLIKWTAALDFETYFNDWLEMATTGRSDDPTTFNLVADDDDVFLSSADPTDTHMPNPAEEGWEGKENGMDALEGRKPRPWSGRSDRSIGDVVLSARDVGFDF
ncbi:hypothetical protein HK104_008817 [Borealophlyctis nickersoniae]|nr:hypothetical protein HK104_008817 [Borealophlyctis nickersoniae]